MPSPTPDGAWTLNNGNWTWTWGAAPNPALVQQYGYNALTNVARDPSGNLNSGTWYQMPETWKWVPGATPDPTLVAMYGKDALTNPDQTPDGALEHSPHGAGSGAWVPQSWTGTWVWEWGMSPDPNLDPGGYSNATLTNADRAPDGSIGPGNTNSPDYPPDDDVVPPILEDVWGGIAPDVTGVVPPGPSTPADQPVSEPPPHPAYMVSPGSIRNAENVLLSLLDTHISLYNGLKTYVAQTADQKLYSALMSKETLTSIQDGLLQSIADGIEVWGNLTGMFNYTAQNYAHADIASFLPELFVTTPSNLEKTQPAPQSA